MRPAIDLKKLSTTAIALMAILAGSIAGTLLTNWLSDWLESVGALWSIGTFFFATLATGLASYVTIERVKALVGIRNAHGAQSKDVAATVLFLAISKPENRSAGASIVGDDEVVRRLSRLRQFIEGVSTSYLEVGGTRVHGNAEAGSLWKIEHLCHKNARLRGDTTDIPLSDFAWQQGWRSLEAQLFPSQEKGFGTDARLQPRLKKIVLVSTGLRMGKDNGDLVDHYQPIVEGILNRHLGKDHGIAIEKMLLAPDRSDEYLRVIEGQLRGRVTAELQGLGADGDRVALDITGADRVYAVASAIVTLQKKVVMVYVQANDQIERGYDVVAFDVEGDFSS